MPICVARLCAVIAISVKSGVEDAFEMHRCSVERRARPLSRRIDGALQHTRTSLAPSTCRPAARSRSFSLRLSAKSTKRHGRHASGWVWLLQVIGVVGGWKFKHPSTQLLAVREDWGMACCLTAFLFFLAKLVSSCRLFLCFLQPQPRRTQSCRSTILGASLDVTLSDSRG